MRGRVWLAYLVWWTREIKISQDVIQGIIEDFADTWVDVHHALEEVEIWYAYRTLSNPWDHATRVIGEDHRALSQEEDCVIEAVTCGDALAAKRGERWNHKRRFFCPVHRRQDLVCDAH